MKRKIAIILVLMIIATIVFTLVCCRQADNGADDNGGSNDEPNNADVKSDYELFKEKNPDYYGDEAQWTIDFASGKLDSVKRYNVLVDGKNLSANVTNGSATSNGATMTLTDCIARLDNTIILPTSSKASWQIKLSGVLSTSNSGAQLLTSAANDEVGRIYLGANAAQNKVYLGINIGGVYFNYCWGVSSAIIKSEHDYVVLYEDGEYWLQIDDGNFYTFDTINYNQLHNVIVLNSEQASNDFNQKVKSVCGQDYFTFSAIGANGFAVNGEISSIQVKTSSIYNHQSLAHHPLQGKTIYHLGSSISYGHANGGVSFAEQIRDITGTVMVKETVSGTTLTNQKDNSYASRWGKFSFTDNPEFLILQLSTNDFAQTGVTLGEVSGKDVKDGFVPNTTASAIEYIIANTLQKSPDTKIIIYTCAVTQSWANANSQYGAFVDNQLKAIKDKWGITVVDLYNADKLFDGILADDIHPNAAGYAAMFTPNLINAMTNLLEK